MDKETIEAILEDCKGLTNKEIIEKYNITLEVQYAICHCSRDLTISQIQERIKRIKPNPKGGEIEKIMGGKYVSV